MFTVRNTLYIAHLNVYSELHILQCLQCSQYTVQCTLESILSIVNNTLLVFSVQRTFELLLYTLLLRKSKKINWAGGSLNSSNVVFLIKIPEICRKSL